MGGDAGLQVDRGDAVGDHVVQVAGDAESFLGEPTPGLLVAGLLQMAGPLLELGQVGPAVSVASRGTGPRPSSS